MKRRVILSITCCLMVSTFIVAPARADFLEDILGLLPGLSYVSSGSGIPANYLGYGPQTLYAPPAYLPAPAPQYAPVMPQQMSATANRMSYQQNSSMPQQKYRPDPSRQSANKQKVAKSTRTKNDPQPSLQTPGSNRPDARRVASYGYHPSGPGAPVTIRQNPPPQTAHYGGYPQQYAAPAPNYYSGYSYPNWGSSGQAACPPGRA